MTDLNDPAFQFEGMVLQHRMDELEPLVHPFAETLSMATIKGLAAKIKATSPAFQRFMGCSAGVMGQAASVMTKDEVNRIRLFAMLMFFHGWEAAELAREGRLNVPEDDGSDQRLRHKRTGP